MHRQRHPWTRLVLAFCLLVHIASATSATQFPRGFAIATGHPLATDAGIAAFEQGGNAIDAAVSAALTLGVVDGFNSGVGGGCFMLIRLADGRIFALDGRETAPASATRDMFVRDGKPDPHLSQCGALASGVPGSVAVYDYAIRRFGRRPWSEPWERAAQTAASGFIIDRHYHERLRDTADDLRRFPASAAIFLDSQGQPVEPGQTLRQPDLAATYRAIGRSSAKWFYRGPFARATDAWMRHNNGLLTARDFARYRMLRREPIRSTYHGYDLVGFPPPSSGGVHVAQILNVLGYFDLPSLQPGHADFIHLATEAMKLAFADRAYWMGDADYARVPRGLVSVGYARTLADRIRPDHARHVEEHGVPEPVDPNWFNRHTTHLSVADAAGNWVALTASLNTSFGSKVVVPGSGVVLNNQMDDFSAQPGTTNYFRLQGSEANAVAPGKRPLSSMSPTMVLHHGTPILAVGASGGPTIITQTVLAILNTIDGGLDLPSALAHPRFHHQWYPDELRVERTMPPATRQNLARRGHAVVETKSLAFTQAVGRAANGRLTAASDPRGQGTAAVRQE